MQLTNYHFYNPKNYLYSKPIKGLQGCRVGYRFHFNGKEGDDEVNGDGNQYDYGFRIYDPRKARFLSIDPLTKTYPMLTPYQFASNSPIMGIDIDGLELQPVNSSMYQMKYYGSITNLNPTKDKVVTYQMYNIQLVCNNIPPFYNNGNHDGITIGTNGKDIPTQTINASGIVKAPSAEDDNKDPTRINITKKGKITDDVKINKKVMKSNTKGSGVLLLVDAIGGAFNLIENLANNDEYKDRQKFYKATKMVDGLEKGEIDRVSGGVLENPEGRAALINYVNDGTLPPVVKDNEASKAYSSLVQKVGDAILKTNKIEIQKK